MRFKFLLFVLLWAGIVNAQDTINYLVITEYRGDVTHRAYLELTNMGDEPVQLNQFKIGQWGGGDLLNMETQKTTEPDHFIPVDKILQPGESYVFATYTEWGPKQFAKGLEGYDEKMIQDNMLEVADFLVYRDEDGDETDLVTEGLQDPFNNQWRANGFYIEQHLSNGDSIVIDQVGGMFIGENGQNLDRTSPDAQYSIAGVDNALATQYLIRKFSVKKGNLDFNNARGVDIADSEWIPIPIHGQAWRLAPWTVGNHGDFNLDENTLESDMIDVDLDNKTLTVPWGVQRGDDIMSYFTPKPGIGWEYVMSPTADSLTHAAQTGDQLYLYVCGSDLDFAVFDIIVEEPAANANMVVPVSNMDPGGGWRTQIDNGYWDWPRVTKHDSGNDTIWGARGGIPYATRVDSLLERLDKPSNADWEIVFGSGIAKPDLSDGDKLKVTAQDGSVKEYYISVIPYRANSDATLTAIQWPDIPEFYKGIFGWLGDTIPGFGDQVFNYNVEVPLMTEGIPALVPTKSDVNATVDVKRARSLSGSPEDRTVTFTVTAEDDSTINNYSVLLTKEKDPNNKQPYAAEPFISEVTHNIYWQGSDYMEICNPGNLPLDLSDYMIAMGGTDPFSVIADNNQSDWLNRYEKYIPGYKWQIEASWVVEPYIAEQDLSVSSTILPGEVFTMAFVGNEHPAMCNTQGFVNPAKNANVQFANKETACNTYVNQWGEQISGGDGTPFGKWHANIIYLFKIVNDSIKQGLKPATDPRDFELIDVLGKEDGTLWTLGNQGINNPFSLRRKPEFTQGNPVLGAALGATPEEAEYNAYNTNYYSAQGFGWPWVMLNILSDVGKHFFNEPTNYISTVGSLVYKVSEGYKSPQEIKGITTGTTVTAFLENIIKADEGQSLTLTSANDGSVLAVDAMLSLNDTLTVLSADSTNTTKYVLEVSEEGLSSDAVLTSEQYEISVDVQPKSASDEHTAGSGTVSGFEYGTLLQTVINNVDVPAGATMTVISGDGAYVPLKRLNFDTTYVSVTVNANTYLEVVAENGTTTIIYQLVPDDSQSSAFVLSDLYSVSQNDLLIQFVPRGSNVQSFLSNLVPSRGATIKLVDKWGFERIEGTVADDDRLLVTSADGTRTVTYHIGKLATEFSPANIYLAYILSNVYGIDQVEYKIHGASGIANISEFYSRIRIAPGATAVVVDESGAEKTTGNLTGSDMVKVTSADGKIVVMYTFGPLTDANALRVDNQLEFYPNPTNGILNVSGLEKGQRIQVYNAVGTAVLDIKTNSSREVISLQNEPSGMYLIVVSKENQLIGRYKAIKK